MSLTRTACGFRGIGVFRVTTAQEITNPAAPAPNSVCQNPPHVNGRGCQQIQMQLSKWQAGTGDRRLPLFFRPNQRTLPEFASISVRLILNRAGESGQSPNLETVADAAPEGDGFCAGFGRMVAGKSDAARMSLRMRPCSPPTAGAEPTGVNRWRTGQFSNRFQSLAYQRRRLRNKKTCTFYKVQVFLNVSEAEGT